MGGVWVYLTEAICILGKVCGVCKSVELRAGAAFCKATDQNRVVAASGPCYGLSPTLQTPDWAWP